MSKPSIETELLERVLPLNSPFPALYPIQEDCIVFLQKDEQHLLIEMPTGSGKTITVLLGLLKKARELGYVIEYYFSTHAQAEEVIKCMGLINESNPQEQPFRALHIGGRKFLCNHLTLREMDGEGDRTERCMALKNAANPLCVGYWTTNVQRSLRSHLEESEDYFYSNPYELNVNDVPVHLDGNTDKQTFNKRKYAELMEHLQHWIETQAILSMKDLNKKGFETGVCPRKIWNMALEYADVICMPKIYLFIPIERIHVQKNIVVIDESHNIEEHCIDHNASELGYKQREKMLDLLKEKWKQEDYNKGLCTPTDLGMFKFSEDIRKDTTRLIKWLNDLSVNNNNAELKNLPLDPVELSNVASNLELMIDRLFPTFDPHAGERVKGFYKAFQMFVNVLMQVKDHENEFIFLKTYVKPKYQKTPPSEAEKKHKGHILLRILDPSTVFHRVTKHASQVVLMSGTLNPDLMKKLLKIEKTSETKVYPSIHKNAKAYQIKRAFGSTLNLTWKNRTPEMKHRFAKVILNIIKHTDATGGVLIFCQNYNIAYELWKFAYLPKNEQRSKSWGLKTYYRYSIEDYKARVKSGKRAIFFSALGGAGAEGENFPDDMARIVILVDIREINMKDELTLSQYNYYKSVYDEDVAEDWKRSVSAKQFGQAYGRLYRHVHDYGIVYILTDRLYRIKDYLPEWVQSKIISKRSGSPLTFKESVLLGKKYFQKMKATY